MGIGALLTVDAGRFDPDCLRPAAHLPGKTAAFWVNAALRVDGELEQRIDDRARKARRDRRPDDHVLVAALAAREPFVRARLQVLAGVERLFQAGNTGLAANDPRLGELHGLARAALAAFGPETVEVPAGDWRSLAAQVAATLRQPREPSREVNAGWQLARADGAMPLVDLHVVLLAIRARAEAIAEHAEHLLARTVDVEMAARYRRLAEGCRDLVAAAAEVLGRG